MPYGFSFLDTAASGRLQNKIRTTQEILIKDGYERVMPPMLDFPETFEVFENFEYFKVRDHLGEDLSLRNDVTVQVIKGYINEFENIDIKNIKEKKLYYMAPVFRDIQKNYPALREVYQAGAEYIGCESKKAITNLIQLASNILKKVCDLRYEIIIGDIRIYRVLSKYLENQDLPKIIKDKNAPALATLFKEKGLSDKTSNKTSFFLLYAEEKNEWLKNWEELEKNYENEWHKNILKEIKNISKFSLELNDILKEKKLPVYWEPLLFRKVHYYTGFFFEGYTEKISSPILRGGSYDSLVSEYSNINLPASGFSLDISPLIH
ncbi:MAG: ATP phosphoribosyltransferase regulatory subunit [Spirochaetia bacterium]|nr:ATP phosphoribosyltransferase regulatory subunit [Spirochaetia bacterium]